MRHTATLSQMKAMEISLRPQSPQDPDPLHKTIVGLLFWIISNSFIVFIVLDFSILLLDRFSEALDALYSARRFIALRISKTLPFN